MRKMLLIGCLFVFLVLFLQSRPCLGCNKAQELYEQASSCFFTAQQEERNSYQRAYAIYRASLSYLERILSECPDSLQASALKKGALTIEHLTYSDFKGSFLPRIKLKAEGEGDLLVCARLVAESVNNNSYRSMSLSSIASLCIRTGREDQALQMIKTARDVNDKDAIKMGIMEGFLETGRAYEALELSREISSPIGRVEEIERCTKALSCGNRNERVFQILSMEEDNLKQSDGNPIKSGLLRMLAEIFHQQGYGERALQLVDQVLIMTRADNNNYERALELMSIA